MSDEQPDPKVMAGEPVAIIAGVQAAIGAVIGLLTAFGATVTIQQENAIIKVYAIVAPIVFGLWARHKVRPKSKT